MKLAAISVVGVLAVVIDAVWGHRSRHHRFGSASVRCPCAICFYGNCDPLKCHSANSRRESLWSDYSDLRSGEDNDNNYNDPDWRHTAAYDNIEDHDGRENENFRIIISPTSTSNPSKSEDLLKDEESVNEEGDDGDHNYYRSPANDEESQTLLISSAPSAPIKIRDSLNDRESMSEYLLDDRESTSEEGDDGDHNSYRSPANDGESQTLIISSTSPGFRKTNNYNDPDWRHTAAYDNIEDHGGRENEDFRIIISPSSTYTPSKREDFLNDEESVNGEGDDGDHNYYRSPAYDEESQIFLIPSTSPGFRETNDNNYNDPDWRHAAAYDNIEDHGGRGNENFRITISPTSTFNPSKSEDLLNDEESVNEEGDDGDHNYYRSPANDEESQTLLISSAPSAPIKIRDSLNDRESMSEYLLDDRESTEEGDGGYQNYDRSFANDEESLTFLIPSTSPGFRETNNYNDPDWHHTAAYDNSEDHGGRENEDFRITISPTSTSNPSKSEDLLNDEESVNEEGDDGDHNYYRSPANDEESQTLLISSAPSAPIKIRDSLNDRESMSEYLLDDRESTSEEGDGGYQNYDRSFANDEESLTFLIPSTSPGFRETNNYNDPDWHHTAAYDNSEDHGGRENEDFRITISPTSTSNPSKSEDLLNDEESVNEEGDDGDHNYYRNPANDEESQTLLISSAPSAPIKIRDSLNDRESMSEYLLDDRESTSEEGDGGYQNYDRSFANDEESLTFLIPSTSPGFRETNNYNDPDWHHTAAYDNSEDQGGRENENFRIIISPSSTYNPSKSEDFLNDEESQIFLMPSISAGFRETNDFSNDHDLENGEDHSNDRNYHHSPAENDLKLKVFLTPNTASAPIKVRDSLNDRELRNDEDHKSAKTSSKFLMILISGRTSNPGKREEMLSGQGSWIENSGQDRHHSSAGNSGDSWVFYNEDATKLFDDKETLSDWDPWGKNGVQLSPTINDNNRDRTWHRTDNSKVAFMETGRKCTVIPDDNSSSSERNSASTSTAFMELSRDCTTAGEGSESVLSRDDDKEKDDKENRDDQSDEENIEESSGRSYGKNMVTVGKMRRRHASNTTETKKSSTKKTSQSKDKSDQSSASNDGNNTETTVTIRRIVTIVTNNSTSNDKASRKSNENSNKRASSSSNDKGQDRSSGTSSESSTEFKASNFSSELISSSGNDDVQGWGRRFGNNSDVLWRFLQEYIANNNKTTGSNSWTQLISSSGDDDVKGWDRRFGNNSDVLWRFLQGYLANNNRTTDSNFWSEVISSSGNDDLKGWYRNFGNNSDFLWRFLQGYFANNNRTTDSNFWSEVISSSGNDDLKGWYRSFGNNSDVLWRFLQGYIANNNRTTDSNFWSEVVSSSGNEDLKGWYRSFGNNSDVLWRFLQGYLANNNKTTGSNSWTQLMSSGGDDDVKGWDRSFGNNSDVWRLLQGYIANNNKTTNLSTNQSSRGQFDVDFSDEKISTNDEDYDSEQSFSLRLGNSSLWRLLHKDAEDAEMSKNSSGNQFSTPMTTPTKAAPIVINV